jgi:hypothetical protein
LDARLGERFDIKPFSGHDLAQSLRGGNSLWRLFRPEGFGVNETLRWGDGLNGHANRYGTPGEQLFKCPFKIHPFGLSFMMPPQLQQMILFGLQPIIF